MSGLPHVDAIKTHFISGEPGTTGREPFEDSTASGPGQNYISPIAAGQDGGQAGQGIQGAHGSHTGAGLAGVGTHGTHGTHENRGVDNLTAGSGLSAHDNHTHSNTNTTGTGAHQKEGLVDKVKDALPGVDGPNDKANKGHGIDNNNNNTHSTTHGTAGTHGTHGLNQQDHQVGAGTAYGAGKHGTDHAGHSGSAFDNVHQDTSQRAPGQKEGGLSGVLGTSDKDFTGRERQGKGAYADTDGPVELNTSGPAGNSALTGREGDISKNPVAQAKSNVGDHTHSSTTGTTGTGSTGVHDTTGTHAARETEHKGFLAKVKEAISK